MRWVVTALLAILTVSFLARLWYELSEKEIDEMKGVWSGASESLPLPEPKRLLKWILMLSGLTVLYPLVLHDVLFTGDGTKGVRSGFIDAVETLSRNRPLVTVVLLPGVFLALSYLRSVGRHQLDRSIRRRAGKQVEAIHRQPSERSPMVPTAPVPPTGPDTDASAIPR